jgi:phage tail protein X
VNETVGTYVVTEDEERIDRIARAVYGAEGNGAVELLLDANPGLAGRGTETPGVLPFGTVLRLPVLTIRADDALARPWE